MEEINEINSHLYMDKKRKFQYDSSDLPLPKHKCRIKNPTLESDFPTNMEDFNLNDVNQSRFDQIKDDSAKDSNSLSSSSVNWDDSINSFDAKTETKGDSFVNFNHDLYTTPSFEGHQLDCGNNDECDSSEYTTEECEDKVLKELLDSNGAVSSNFVLSSGRWDVNNQDTQEDTEKLTIDKEFEQYFSMLML